MERSTFDTIIAHPCSLSLAEKKELQSALSQYPYSSVLRVLDLLGDKSCGLAQWETTSLPNAQRYLLDAAYMDSLLLQAVPAPISGAGDEATKQHLEAEQARKAAEASEPFDIMKEINAYQEVSFKTAPKSVILSSFLENGVFDSPEMEASQPVSIETLGKKSIVQDDDLDTETLAVIFEKQGKYELALGVYQKLMSKYPEKSSTFAVQIETLKTKIESNKK